MNIKPLNNYVLLKSICDPSKVKLEGGKILHIDTSWNRAKHASVICEVIATPDRLHFGIQGYTDKGQPIPKANSMEWETDMELQVGDEVIIHYMGYLNAFHDDKRTFILDGQEYFFCPYEQIYAAKRKWKSNDAQQFWQNYNASTTKYITLDWMAQHNVYIDEKSKDIFNVIMLNGYVLAQPIEKQYKSDLLILPESLKNTNKEKLKVYYCGKPNRRYIESGVYVDSDINAGDIILVDKANDVPLEYTPSFIGGESFWRLQRNQVHAMYQPEVVNAI